MHSPIYLKGPRNLQKMTAQTLNLMIVRWCSLRTQSTSQKLFWILTKFLITKRQMESLQIHLMTILTSWTVIRHQKAHSLTFLPFSRIHQSSQLNRLKKTKMEKIEASEICIKVWFRWSQQRLVNELLSSHNLI